MLVADWLSGTGLTKLMLVAEWLSDTGLTKLMLVADWLWHNFEAQGSRKLWYDASLVSAMLYFYSLRLLSLLALLAYFALHDNDTNISIGWFSRNVFPVIFIYTKHGQMAISTCKHHTCDSGQYILILTNQSECVFNP
jgi:hypothetical protein